MRRSFRSVAARRLLPAIAAMALIGGPGTAHGSAARAPVARTLGITLAPRPGGTDQATIAAVDVVLRFSAVSAKPGEPLVELQRVASNIPTFATLLDEVEARDARGPLRLTWRDVDLAMRANADTEAGGPTRIWTADRAVSGPLTIRYTLPAGTTLPRRGPGPPFELSINGGAVSLASSIFLLLPPGDATYRPTVTWNLSALPKGAIGVSSYGFGQAGASKPLTADQLREAFYMAGASIGRWPRSTPARGFFSAWQGTPPYDAASLMQWTGKLYGRYSTFFGEKTPPSYGVFLRYSPTSPGGGVSLYKSFIATFGGVGGRGADPEAFKITLAHEMFHTFQPYIDQSAGLESSWFAEGLASLYQTRLPLRFGAITPERFLDELNTAAGRYYTNIMATLRNAEIAKQFWADTRVRMLVYDRGMLYFAGVDDAIRKASGGKRSLDTIVLALLARQNGGAALTTADWEAALHSELGDGAVADFRAFIDGRMPIPASDAFGPCFRRTMKPLRRFEMGFSTEVVVDPRHIVRGLVPGSAADKAGLRNGDEIVSSIPQDGIQGDQTQLMKLTMRRDGKTIPISYLPRGETVEAYQWERVPGVPDAACAL